MGCTFDKGKGKTKNIRLDWKNMGTDEVMLGTPMGEDGTIHNDEKAVGLLTKTVTTPWCGTADILVSGEVDKKEVEELSGVKITAKAQKALHDINFSGSSRGAGKKAVKSGK